MTDKGIVWVEMNGIPIVGVAAGVFRNEDGVYAMAHEVKGLDNLFRCYGVRIKSIEIEKDH